MIYLNNYGSKNIVVTLAAKTIAATPSYIWNLNDADTNINYNFCADDTSPAPWNYNQFSFSVITGATQGLTAGIISAPIGQFGYTVYETNYPYDLNIASASGIVETGILLIEGTASPISTYNNTNQIPTYKRI